MPNDLHVIRLRGPWQLEPIERYLIGGDGQCVRSTDVLPPTTRATMPADWSESLGRGFRGSVRYHRVFQWLTPLETGEQAYLVVEPPRSRGIVSLGGEVLGEVVWGGPPGRFHVTQRLRDRNRLEIVVEHPVLDARRRPDDDDVLPLPGGGLVGEVRLEIEE